MSKKADSQTQILLEFVTHRNESGSLVIFSSPLLSQWDQVFPDSMMTVAAVDRISHHATIIVIDAQSFSRKKQKN